MTNTQTQRTIYITAAQALAATACMDGRSLPLFIHSGSTPPALIRDPHIRALTSRFQAAGSGLAAGGWLAAIEELNSALTPLVAARASAVVYDGRILQITYRHSSAAYAGVNACYRLSPA